MCIKRQYKPTYKSKNKPHCKRKEISYACGFITFFLVVNAEKMRHESIYTNARTDRKRYHEYMKHALELTPGLAIHQAEVVALEQ